ncbi:hypothetical protein [Amycolatopsis anabasis]|uniref:hypothetical protein n=1 Tax=Amycolatopsis anabasis TaxID=1840409 RepID=UPI00131C6CE1|nr:hypothetical protein [Amycolatopsis anabasis]
MRRKASIVGLLVGGAFFVAGCSSVTSGTVTGKEYEPETTVLVPTCTIYDSKGMCVIWTPLPFTDPECWRLDLDDGKATGSVCVSRQDYDRYKKGDRYPA